MKTKQKSCLFQDSFSTKIDKKIKEIVESKEDNLYIHEDKEIMNYEDYLKIGLREKNLEDLIDFNVNSFILWLNFFKIIQYVMNKWEK